MSDATSLLDFDPWLKPHRGALAKRSHEITANRTRLLGSSRLDEFALGHTYFGLHKTKTSWVLREWAPNAQRMGLVGDCNNWTDGPEYEFTRLSNGQWELLLPLDALKHGQHYKLRLQWRGGSGDRLPSYATYVIQDPITLSFDAIVWQPELFAWHDASFQPSNEAPLIYEAHVGMSSDKPEVATYAHFTENVLPRIKAAGYNTVQLMAIQEHPYYGSFGYHVSNFFAASSRFGTPDDLKRLVDTAHGMGLNVIMDLVHSHAARNENEGLSRFDGSLNQYFHAGPRGTHPAWDSRTFDYGKSEVFHFLLSNCRFWLDEYHFDGFRFDGVTSMLYKSHGLNQNFVCYDDYFTDDVDIDALTYLQAANELIHTIKPSAITIAEDMSGFPGLCLPAKQDGMGFDYRLSMGVPDLWIKTLKESRDEEWNLNHLLHELTTKRPEEAIISYSESHDQALVGDKTLIFRLIDKDMYDHMSVNDGNLNVERGIALIKLIRLITAACHGGGYLNFMGNEFGHPEWIDFPREGNGWSYAYARRQWKLADDKTLRYHWLANFDAAMMATIAQLEGKIENRHVDQANHIVSFTRDGYVFAFNFSPDASVVDYALPVPEGSYEIALTSDDSTFGGQERIDPAIKYVTRKQSGHTAVSVYLPARTALVLRKSS